MVNFAVSIEEELSQETWRLFKERIVSLLYFGTRAFNLNINNDSDFDFMLVLKEYKDTDVIQLRQILRKKPFSKQDINLNLMYLSDFKVRGKTNFQIRSLSLPFYQYLGNAKILLGRNIFKDDPIGLTRMAIRESEDFKIQEYYGRCDKLYFQNITDEKLFLQLRKYVKDIVWLLLLREGILKSEDLTKTSYDEILKKAERHGLITKTLAGQFRTLLKRSFSKRNLLRLENLRRSVYRKYLSHFAHR